MKKNIFAALALTATASPALAHHPLGGLPMETLAHGLMSGVGHPVLGFDHLFFVVAVGILALFTANRFLAPAAYIGAMLVGCGLMYAGVAMPAAELVIVASLVVAGGLLASGRGVSPTAIVALFAVFGLFHGSAFGGSIAGQEGGVGGAVLVGYLVGLGAIQYAIALFAGWAASKAGSVSPASVNARLVGAAIAGVGLFLGLEVIEGPIVALLSAA
ncbi:HupE/UreJ family protein [Octadecabacter sp. 1_MG-2023]|uniref:HupE/UreJ family protein n=1 Tax=unclassified Octadecabacter TaxID=196158 RepID=UPI001C09153A|nr:MULTISPECIES: HupE/UreJ family protein [unclassified Octadecabacter]MBU2992576.1 HupE/UreJ family protein [Octadecabacter sp. B2R22]MDO6734667.1 HupE/UreJ family protein [Octadecabacter sp. 1_MG-2023]